MKKELINHYDLLIEEENDPVNDPLELQEYMEKWDGTSFIHALDLSIDKNVLEIGVGTGRLALKVIDKCKSFTGIDISSNTIERARIRLGEKVNLICDEFITYNFKNKYDVIYSSLTFIHFEDKLEVLEKCSLLLKESGRLVVSIDKSKDTILDYGSRKIHIFPITKYSFINKSYLVGFKLLEIIELEFAYIFVLKK